MQSTLVQRLRSSVTQCRALDRSQLLEEAAAEIDRLRLTDAEREAVEWCVEMAVLHAKDCDAEVKAMRGLLERTK